MSRPLLLVPTAMERERLIAAFAHRGGVGQWQIELCGFGVIAAAALTTRHLIRHRPDHVVLAGIAGTLHPDIAVGSAVWFSEVLCDGIGVGGEFGDPFISASELGWSQVNLPGAEDGNPIEISDRLPLMLPTTVTPDSSPLERASSLLTVCAASASPAMAACRRERARDQATADLVAEDMEGFAVATACRLANVPLSIIRGISNIAGDRDHRRWEIDLAIDRIAERLARDLPPFQTTV
ncbi:futalosine hydrolase [Neorhodopirellula pilleata]|uniref:futalosine hydrolase n=1 Tax=Neorhodopirellula pilleata TaxID=2714738 RepID=UPI0011B430A2|nr:futalosine hydrolase [Neorhodopirellula pilleata]